MQAPGYLSLHFSEKEAACKGSGKLLPPELRPNAVLLANEVGEVIRDAWGGPLTPISWYRDPEYNEYLFKKSVERAQKRAYDEAIAAGKTVQQAALASANARGGVAKDSQHMTGGAFDIQPRSLADVPDLHRLVLRLWNSKKLPKLGGLGLYPGWIHVDTFISAPGHLRQWGGIAFGDEPR